MTLIIGKYSPVNIVRVNDVLRSQYIIPTNDLDMFLSAQAKTQGLVGFEGRAFIFEGINIDIKRKTGTFELKTNQFGTEVIDTFEYFMQPVDVSESYISSSSFVNSYAATTTTWGVKEADADLTADYDLYNDDYNKITHLGYADITKNTSGSLYSSGSSSSDKFHQNYQTVWETRSLADLTRTVNVQTGIYSHVYSKGIRAFMIGAGHYDLTKTFVVVKNVANGQGIRKTNRQLWNCAATVTFSRWTA